MNKDKICEYIKKICESEQNIDYNDMVIDIIQSKNYFFRNSIIINNTLLIKEKNDKYCFFASGNLDDEMLAKYAFDGYIKEKLTYDKKIKEETEYKKKHPLLSLFRLL